MATRSRARGAAGQGGQALINRITLPFVGGVNTDLPSWALDPQATPTPGQDWIAPKGVACLRGTFALAGGMTTLGPTALFGAIACDLPSYGGAGTQPASPIVVGTDQAGRVGIFNSGFGSAGISGVNALLPREVYKGEVLLCPQDGVGSIRRFPGAPVATFTNNSAAAGTVGLYQGTSFVLGIGSGFLSQARVGTYLSLGGFPGTSRLVVSVDDDTHLSVDGLVPGTVTHPGTVSAVPGVGAWSSNTAFSRLGNIGLCIAVQTLGQFSLSTGLGTTVAGFGSLWNTANTPPGHGRPLAGDYIGPTGSGDRLYSISSITNDYTLVVTAAPVADYANTSYAIYRPAMGRECRYHQGRLYITGVDWDPTGVYYLPVNAPLGAFINTDNPLGSISTNYAVSQLLLKFDVPIAGAQGWNVALLSTPDGLLILRTDGAWMSYGDPPTNTVASIAVGAGCIDIRSACVGARGEGAFWVGINGIYRYTGGRVVDLVEGKRSREWRKLMAQVAPLATISTGLGAAVNCAVHDGHLIVSVAASNTGLNQTWVYDLTANAWVGNIPGGSGGSGQLNVLHYAPYRGSGRNASADALFFIPSGTSGPVAVTALGTCTDVFKDEGTVASGSGAGTFQADLPESVTGTPDGLSRVIEQKVVYELTGGDTTTKLACQSGADGGALGTDASLATTAGGPQEARVLPQWDVTQAAGGAIGVIGRRHAHRLAGQGTTPSALRVHEVDIVVRPRRPRA